MSRASDQAMNDEWVLNWSHVQSYVQNTFEHFSLRTFSPDIRVPDRRSYWPAGPKNTIELNIYSP